MNALATPFQQLVERRLWPIAVLLVAALAAVPMLLSKSADEAPAPLAMAASGAQGATQPIVSQGDPAARESVRKVLGSRKNPFRPAVKARAASEEGTGTTTAPPAPTTGGAPSGGGVTVPGVTVPIIPKPTFELHSLFVRFGDSTASELTARNLKRLTELPRSAPALVYLGLLADHKTAVFLVDAGAKVQGDGQCLPSPENCQTLRMKVGDTVFVDVQRATGAKQYQLDLVKIAKRRTTSLRELAKAYAAEDAGGRETLRANMARMGRLRYDRKSGTLKRISKKAYAAAVAKAAAAK